MRRVRGLPSWRGTGLPDRPHANLDRQARDRRGSLGDPLGDGLELPSPAGAAAAGDIALAYTMYARTNLAARDPAVIVGASPVTRFLVEILVAKGVTPSVVLDPALSAFADWCRGRGATVTSAAELAATMAAQGMGNRPYRILAVSELAAACALAGPRATLTLLAPETPADLPGLLLAREVLVIPVAAAHPDLIVECAALCAKGEVDLAAGTSLAPVEGMFQARLSLPT
ncbi:MAG: hypothetical protein WKG01_21675 [Kofleriaceae bacterium]